MKKDFEQFYNSLNKEEFRELWEKINYEKKKRKKRTFKIITIVDLCLLIVLALLIKVFNTELGLFIIYPLTILFLVIDLVIGLFSYGIIKESSEYNSKYKEIIMDNLLKNFFDNVDYVPKKEFSENTYRESEIYEGYDRYWADDYVDALVDNKYRIQLANIHTEEEEESEDANGRKTTHYVTTFWGLFAVINMEKSINGKLKITENLLFKGKNALEMDSSEFEKYFDVTATDKVVGMQLLTHDVMSTLVSLGKILRKRFAISVIDNKLYIKIAVGSLFENRFNEKEIIDKEITKNYFEILDFTDALVKMFIKNIEDTPI